jgi:hypothetical protein
MTSLRSGQGLNFLFPLTKGCCHLGISKIEFRTKNG